MDTFDKDEQLAAIRSQVAEFGPNLNLSDERVRDARAALSEASNVLEALTDDATALVTGGVSEEAIYDLLFAPIVMGGPSAAIAVIVSLVLESVKSAESVNVRV